MSHFHYLKNKNFHFPTIVLGTLLCFTLLLPGAETRGEQNINSPNDAPGKIRNETGYVEGEVLVTFKKGISSSEAQALSDSFSLQINRHYKAISQVKGQVYMHIKSRTKTTAEMLSAFKKHPSVANVSPNYRLYMDVVPNDPDFRDLWGLHNTGQTGGTVDVDVDAPEAWEKHTGSTGVIVAVIDTGIQYNHTDLAANMWLNPGEIADNNIDDDGNGYVDDVYGINSITGSGDPMDDNGHGSHCAGTIGAVANDDTGVVGVNWNVKLMAAKFLDSEGSGVTSDSVACIDYIVNMKTNYGQNIVAINASYGGGAYSLALSDAIDAAGTAGIVFCAAAGNDSTNNDSIPHYPSSYSGSSILAVTAVDHNGNQVYNYGATSVDLGAPGYDILSTIRCIYTPQATDIFYDNLESGFANWTTGGTNNTWAISDDQESFYDVLYPVPSPTSFLSDSPGSNYLPFTDSWIMNNANIDLSTFVGTDLNLGFGSAMYIEDYFDHGYVEVSGDGGTTWLALKDFSGYGNYWRTGYCYLIPDSVKTQNFRFRFRMVSDDSVEYWGWLIDNVGIGKTVECGYAYKSGTSMATPHVAGAVGLIAAQYPAESVAQRIARIVGSTVPLASLNGKCVTGGLLNLDQALGTPPGISVTAPSLGQSVNVGSQLSIQWESTGITGDVSIILRNILGTEKLTVTDAVSYDGSPYLFTIPGTITPGDYIVRIKQGTLRGDSAIFQISQAPVWIRVDGPVAGPFNTGGTFRVEWSSAGIVGDVKIILRRSDGTEGYVLEGAAPYDGSPREYTLPCFSESADYFVRVKQGIIIGESPDLLINAGPCISVTSPLGGESFAPGQQLSIGWNTHAITGTLRVILRRADGSGGYVINAAIPFDGSPLGYSIPLDVITGEYFIRIKQGDYIGESANFNIN